jgi:hypothetical protein
LTITLEDRFRRACREVPPEDQEAIFRLLLNLDAAFANPHRHHGVGLRKLHPSEVWEARIGLSRRALFYLQPDEAVFVFLGTHDEVRRYLRAL